MEMTPGELIFLNNLPEKDNRYTCPWQSIIPISKAHVERDLRVDYSLSSKELLDLNIRSVYNKHFWWPLNTKYIRRKKSNIVTYWNLIEQDYLGWKVEARKLDRTPIVVASKKLSGYDIYIASIAIALSTK